ncbi:uronate isomerase [Oceanicola granulosus HTCC2516]|uniref:Uronate isomerase n=1 Tax=Oceanicola granulosus (strain ATCC BAA-861 / DSM 15982 / KCTC 12143 / HTCC2516) TaxID=314256 RepID=Q2CCW5_OCEGH|nr:glucuronate isomerase [Oceanicola granulosus]EAR50508.1 uronate isomerase [Oceanicola granulosus HTCC2516]
MSLLHPDRLFPAEPGARAVARELYEAIGDAPILSPHGHCDPAWFAGNEPFPDPARLFVVPDHYVFRMLVSQGVPLNALGVPRVDGGETEQDPRAIWRLFAAHYHLFRGTPTRMWIDHAFETVFGVTERLSSDTAERIYDQIAERLTDPAYRPRALFERFDIAALATTDGALDDLAHHEAIRDSGWGGRVIPTYRPDAVTDPEYEGFAANVAALGRLTGEDTSHWEGYLAAHRARRADFRALGATATDHGVLTARTADLPPEEAAALYKACLERPSPVEAALFRAQMLTEMARMSVEDGMTLQIHAGSLRNHSAEVLARHGRDKGFDIPQATDYVHALKPLLDAVGMEPGLTVIPFTLDETVYARELAPLAGVYPALTLGPPWWFHDSFEGMLRFRRQTGETAGIYNTAGFNDDTRAFCSIPARHDVARRTDCHWLATLVADHRIGLDEAHEMAQALTSGLARKAYSL